MHVRKAGEEVTPELYQTIWKHLKTDGVPDQAANQMTAEMVTHGEDSEGGSLSPSNASTAMACAACSLKPFDL